MEYPVSLFIMDVADSSRIDTPDALAEYLDQTVGWIEELASQNKTTLSIRVKHRFGDEIILVAEEFTTAYTLAFFIKNFWRYQQNPPYFGLTVGSLSQSVAHLPDLDRWLHPMINTARVTLDELKETKSVSDRQWLLMNASEPPLLHSVEETNELLEIQDYLLKSQSTAQKTAGALYAVFQQQAQIASFLDKDPSTISRQLKAGAADLIVKIHRRIEHRLVELQSVYSASRTSAADPGFPGFAPGSTADSTAGSTADPNPPAPAAKTAELVASYIHSHLEQFVTGWIR
ncbi:MAG: hypothetical protein ACYCYO_04690 [Bacilli bacterium]